MKILAKGKVSSMTEGEDGGVDVEVTFTGKVSDVAQTAKDCSVSVMLTVKGLVAEQLKWGQPLYLTISTEAE